MLLLVLLSNATSLPFIMSADGLLGCEADAVVCKLAFTYAEKTDKPYSVVCGFICKCISIAMVWATHTPLSLRLPYSLRLYEFSPCKMAGWCRPESVPSVTSLFLFLSSLPNLPLSPSWWFPSFLFPASPLPSPHLLLFFNFTVLPDAFGPWWLFLPPYSLLNFL